MALIVLPTEEDRENAHLLGLLDDIEPDNRPPQRDMAQARQEVVMQRTAMRCSGEAFDLLADRLDALLSLADRRLDRFAEAEIAVDKKLEDKLEVSFGLGGE